MVAHVFNTGKHFMLVNDAICIVLWSLMRYNGCDSQLIDTQTQAPSSKVTFLTLLGICEMFQRS